MMATHNLPDGEWLVSGGLLYRLKDGTNCDEINVTMAGGSRDDLPRNCVASYLQGVIAKSAQATAAAPSAQQAAGSIDTGELRRLAEAATPGEWHWGGSGEHNGIEPIGKPHCSLAESLPAGTLVYLAAPVSGQSASIANDKQFKLLLAKSQDAAIVAQYAQFDKPSSDAFDAAELALVQFIDSRQRSEDSRARPDFFKGAPVEVCNEHGHIYSAVVTRSETRWSADQKPYIYYRVRAEGETTDNVIVASAIISKPPALASTTPQKANNE